MNLKSKQLWLDMEMTGLEVEKEVPIEVAAIVTNWNFETLGTFHTIIKQEQKYIDAMDDWNKRQHGISGLTALIPSGKPMADTDRELSEFIQKHFAGERAILYGNSISQDRLFIRRYLPLTESKLHYRMMDVSSWKVVFNELYDLKYKKKEGHRALDDIGESMNELKFYLSHIKPVSNS
jgi:oligoribonuclease